MAGCATPSTGCHTRQVQAPPNAHRDHSSVGMAALRNRASMQHHLPAGTHWLVTHSRWSRGYKMQRVPAVRGPAALGVQGSSKQRASFVPGQGHALPLGVSKGMKGTNTKRYRGHALVGTRRLGVLVGSIYHCPCWFKCYCTHACLVVRGWLGTAARRYEQRVALKQSHSRQRPANGCPRALH